MSEQCPGICSPFDFARLTGLSEGAVRRMCLEGRLDGAQKIGSSWVINRDVALGKAAPGPARPSDVDVDELASLVASKLWQAFATGFAGISTTTRF